MKALLERALALTVLAVATGCARPNAPVASGRATIVDVAPSAMLSAAPAPPAGPAPPPGRAVRVGNQHALNGAALPFAKYLNAMHNRIHGPFTEEALAGLDALPPNDPRNDKSLVVRLELVIEGTTGKLLREIVARSGGVTAFDEVAVDAVRRAAPFAPANAVLWSSDGNVYVHWELSRDPVLGCSLRYAQPYLIDVGPPPARGAP